VQKVQIFTYRPYVYSCVLGARTHIRLIWQELHFLHFLHAAGSLSRDLVSLLSLLGSRRSLQEIHT
jgi:hypothetical protein